MGKWRWDDKKFVTSYQQIMGTILACKIPISANAILAIRFITAKTDVLMSCLKPLLLTSEVHQPKQTLHQSLHDFLTIQAHKVEKWRTFAIDGKSHSQQLALSTLKVMNTELSKSTPGTCYVFGKIKGIPKTTEISISEQLSYSCKFWLDHLQEITDPPQELDELLSQFLEDKLVLWAEVTVCLGDLQDIGTLLKWIEVRIQLDR